MPYRNGRYISLETPEEYFESLQQAHREELEDMYGEDWEEITHLKLLDGISIDDILDEIDPDR